MRLVGLFYLRSNRITGTLNQVRNHQNIEVHMSSHTRHIYNRGLHDQIADVRHALERVKPQDRLQVIAEAMVNLQDPEVNYQSCGCYDWDITIDYRNADQRAGNEKPSGLSGTKKEG